MALRAVIEEAKAGVKAAPRAPRSAAEAREAQTKSPMGRMMAATQSPAMAVHRVQATPPLQAQAMPQGGLMGVGGMNAAPASMGGMGGMGALMGMMGGMNAAPAGGMGDLGGLIGGINQSIAGTMQAGMHTQMGGSEHDIAQRQNLQTMMVAGPAAHGGMAGIQQTVSHEALREAPAASRPARVAEPTAKGCCETVGGRPAPCFLPPVPILRCAGVPLAALPVCRHPTRAYVYGPSSHSAHAILEPAPLELVSSRQL